MVAEVKTTVSISGSQRSERSAPTSSFSAQSFSMLARLRERLTCAEYT